MSRLLAADDDGGRGDRRSSTGSSTRSAALLQHGAIRFGLPIGVVVGAVTEARWPAAATPARAFQLVTVAVASIWALEAFAYTLLTRLAVAAF